MTGLGELVVVVVVAGVVVVVAGVVVVAAGVVVVVVEVEAVVRARVVLGELCANATSPAMTAHEATNSVTAPVAARRRIARTRSAFRCLIDCAWSLVMATASVLTVGPA